MGRIRRASGNSKEVRGQKSEDRKEESEEEETVKEDTEVSEEEKRNEIYARNGLLEFIRSIRKSIRRK